MATGPMSLTMAGLGSMPPRGDGLLTITEDGGGVQAGDGFGHLVMCGHRAGFHGVIMTAIAAGIPFHQDAGGITDMTLTGADSEMKDGLLYPIRILTRLL